MENISETLIKNDWFINLHLRRIEEYYKEKFKNKHKKPNTMKQQINELEINGVIYVPKGANNTQAVSIDGLPYVMCRTYSAGVFAGYLQKREGQEGRLLNARRIWAWAGATSLSQLATSGTTQPSSCKFAEEVEYVDLLQIIEILPITEVAKKKIEEVAIWKS